MVVESARSELVLKHNLQLCADTTTTKRPFIGNKRAEAPYQPTPTIYNGDSGRSKGRPTIPSTMTSIRRL